MKNTWKFHERAVSKAFGTNRVPMSGAVGSLKTHSDSFHPNVYLECKYRTSELGPLYRLYDGVKNQSKKLKKLPALLLIKKGSRRRLLIIHNDHIQGSYPKDFETVEITKKFIFCIFFVS